VFCVDEKTAIQALDRKDRMLPLSPGRGKTASRHTSAQFVALLTEVVSAHRATQEIHVICDSVSSHKTPAVQTFLLDHPNVTMHHTPTYSSWLNQVENWFARIQRDVITRSVFTSTKDLDKKLMRYIRQYNKQAAPLKWKYDEPKRRIRCDSSGSTD
ncbi:transposase, partial [Caballeronia choica]|uniref:transposase n=1 Tax=Caballeronia choica TaxID=326476 RepID=UPI00190E74F2